MSTVNAGYVLALEGGYWHSKGGGVLALKDQYYQWNVGIAI